MPTLTMHNFKAAVTDAILVGGCNASRSALVGAVVAAYHVASRPSEDKKAEDKEGIPTDSIAKLAHSKQICSDVIALA